MLKFHEMLTAMVVIAGFALTASPSFADNGKGTFTNPEDEAADTASPEIAIGFGSLEDLLNASGLAYRKMENDTYRITYEANGEVSVITAWEITMYTDNDGNPVKVVYLYSWLLDFPDGFQPSIELYHAVAQKNLNLNVGQLMMNDYGMMFSNSFWLNSATLNEFDDELFLAHVDREAFASMFRPFVEEALEELN